MNDFREVLIEFEELHEDVMELAGTLFVLWDSLANGAFEAEKHVIWATSGLCENAGKVEKKLSEYIQRLYDFNKNFQ